MVELKQNTLTLTKNYCCTVNGAEVYCFTLCNDDVEVIITNIGCAIVSIVAPDKNGNKKNIVAGFADIKEYAKNPDYLGCVLGRYANRIAGGIFNLHGEKVQLSLNDGGNHLHGGANSFSRKTWNIASVISNEKQVGVVFEYRSMHGEEGYPGNLNVSVTYLLNSENQLRINYQATTDKSTPVNLSNHSYFNLTGFECSDILQHYLQINAQHYTEKNGSNTPSGKIALLHNTPLDFSISKAIGECIDQFHSDNGFDHNYVLESDGNTIAFAAELMEPETGRVLRIFTNQPGLQLYTANSWKGNTVGRQGVPCMRHGAVALETQAFPDSPNHPNFPNTILHPGEIHQTTTIYEFDTM